MRAGASPRQNGTVGGAPCASSTRTTPPRTLWIRQRRGSEEEDVAGRALDGEVLVQRPHLLALRLGDDRDS